METADGDSEERKIEPLIRAAQAGSQDAYGRLVEIYQSPVRVFLRGLAGWDNNLGDDLAQDTFLIGFQRIRSFRGEGHFLSWLMGIGYHRFLEYSRKKRRRLTLLQGWSKPLATEPSSSYLKIDLEKALSRLSVSERAVLLLYGREGMTLQEITDLTGIPLGTVKSHLSRGRTKLKKNLSRETEDG